MSIKHLYIVLLLIFNFASTELLNAQDNDYSKILWSADWSPNGEMIAVGGAQGTLKIFSKKGFKLKNTYSFKGTITSIKWHPFENIIALATQNSKTKTCIINLDDEKITTLDNVTDEGGARAIDWNYTGEYLAVGDNGGGVLIFSKTGNLIRKIDKGNTFSNTGLSWHPTENIFVIISKYIHIFNLDGKLLHKIKHRTDDILLLCAAWHPSGEFFAIGDYGYENYPSLIQFWSKEGKLLKSIEQSKAEYRSIRWTKDGKKLATASDALRIFSAEGDLIGEGQSPELLWGLDWNKNENCLITSGIKGGVTIWNKKAKAKKYITF